MTTYSSDSLGSVSEPDTNINTNVMLTACGGDGGGGEGILGVGMKFPSDKLIKVVACEFWQRGGMGNGTWTHTQGRLCMCTQTKAHTHTHMPS